MTITLDDVPYLIGVPIEGLAVHAEVHGKEDCVALLRIWLGVTKRNAKAAVCCGGVMFDWLWNTFHEVEDDATDDRVDNCVRAYLLYLLGTTLFVDKTGIRVNVSYLALLSDLTLVSTYAWGVGVLGFLYRQLGQASRCHVKGMGGYTTLLEVLVINYDLHMCCTLIACDIICHDIRTKNVDDDIYMETGTYRVIQNIEGTYKC
ncbi:hypothetical protein RHGRI_030895 [Rhododendron griersonianum]|uniref:Aminotransferase-like plant mobile domain-containing protein n=1 Tax=Rhododendron griersonianum TaxID=479676 RepID=A0AAV6I5Q7_9ERIC|nr:hypothetical protein RHGRI_030895 [Rhododendron griersonianum]